MRIIVPVLREPSPRGSVDDRFQIDLKPVSCWLKGKSLQKLTSLTFAGCSAEPRLHNDRGCTLFSGGAQNCRGDREVWPSSGREAELLLLPCKLPEDTWVSWALASKSASSETL